MCTGLLAICTCNHYQVMYWTTRCENACKYPNNWLQYVDFQCRLCDLLDQSLLELEISTQSRLALVDRTAREAWEREKRDVDMDREIVRRMCYTGDMTNEEREEWETDLEEKLRTWQESATNDQRRRKSEVWTQHEMEVMRLEQEAAVRARGAAVAGGRRRIEIVEDRSRNREET